MKKYSKHDISTKILKFAKKIKAIEILGGKCQICGNVNMHELQFHHTSDDKEIEISKLRGSRFSLIEKELKKCILLCRNCHRELHYNIKNDNKDIRIRGDKQIYLEYKGNKCQKCSYDKCNAALEFHHRINNEKEFIVSSLVLRMTSLSDLSQYIKNELDKCDVLCSNCHQSEHTDIEFFNKYKNEIYDKVKSYKEIQCKIDRLKVYELYDSGIKQIDIAKYFNASKGTISDILKKRIK